MATRSQDDNTEAVGHLLTPSELIARWKNSITAATLATWRSRKLGPAYTKIGGRVLYPLSAVEAWERKRTMLPSLASALSMLCFI